MHSPWSPGFGLGSAEGRALRSHQVVSQVVSRALQGPRIIATGSMGGSKEEVEGAKEGQQEQEGQQASPGPSSKSHASAQGRKPAKALPASHGSKEQNVKVMLAVAVGVAALSWALYSSGDLLLELPGLLNSLASDSLARESSKSTPKTAASGPNSASSSSSSSGGGAGAAVECSDQDTVNYQRLAQLLRRNGAKLNVELGVFKGVRGLAASRDIKKDTPVLSVPLNMSISIASFSARSEAGGLSSEWQTVEDADMQLDALALVYEAYAKGPQSRFAQYMCMLPKQYALPVLYKDTWSQAVVRALPDLARLVDKRAVQVTLYGQLAKKAMLQFQGAKDVMWRDSKHSYKNFLKAFQWAYAATKTRTVTLDLEELESAGRPLALPRGLQWLREFGVMVPILDLANHASSAAATAYMAVDTSLGSGSGDGRQPFFVLLAARDLREGEQITFSYLPDDDEEPACNTRWLLEYGFIVRDGRPQRDCFTFNITAEELGPHLVRAKAMLAPSPPPSSSSNDDSEDDEYDDGDGDIGGAGKGVGEKGRKSSGREEVAAVTEELLNRLEDKGLPSWATAYAIRGSGPEGMAEAFKLVMTAAKGDERVAGVAVCGLLAQHKARLQAQLLQSQGSQEEGPAAALPPYQKADLLEVLKGAIRAVDHVRGEIECPRALIRRSMGH